VKKVFGLIVLLLFAFGVTACAAETTEPQDPDTLIVQFVPSNMTDTELLTKVMSIQTMLETELTAAGYDINVLISIGTSYTSVIEAMVSGQVDVAFLTAQQYAYITLKYPGVAQVLLTSVRDAYLAQLDESNNVITDKSIIIANANAEGYDGTTTSAVKVSSYYSMLLIDKDDYAAYQTEGIAWLKGKNVATQTTTSGSGYVYPSFLLYENGMSFVPNTDGPDAAAGEVGYTTVANHQAGVLALLNGEVDACFTYFDSRTSTTAFETWQAANPDLDRFEETRVVALTEGIYNDTISSRAALSAGLKAAIQQAFINIIATEDGYAALQIYNHKGYLVAVDSDYDGERALYQFLHPTA
jgi:phosphonate transport system substrate-binding protein